jgi:hypothetical protein
VSTTGEFDNMKVKLVVQSALKSIMPESITPVTKVKDKSEIRLLEKYKEFDDDDRKHWLAHYKIEITNSDIFFQVQTLRNEHYYDDNFYWSVEMRGMIPLIVRNHLNTDWGKEDWRIKRAKQRWLCNYIVDKDKDYEVIAVTYVRFLDEEGKDYESEYRIYKDDKLQDMFTSKYFDG